MHAIILIEGPDARRYQRSYPELGSLQSAACQHLGELDGNEAHYLPGQGPDQEV